MKTLVLTLVLLLALAAPAYAADMQDVTLAWDAPTTNADGTPLTDLAGYKLYGGVYTKSGAIESCEPPYALIANTPSSTPAPTGTVTEQTIVVFEERKIPYCVMVTAFDLAGNESLPSDSRPAFIVHVTPGKAVNVRCVNCQ